MLRRIWSRFREWVSVEDPDERIEGSGEAITSPQHRRSADAERVLHESREAAEDRSNTRRDE